MPSVKNARILIGGCGCSKVLEMWQGELYAHLAPVRGGRLAQEKSSGFLMNA